MRAVQPGEDVYKAKLEMMTGYASWEGVPNEAFDKIIRLGVTLDKLVDECQLDALAVRCWTEMQTQLGISPCVLMGALNDGGVASACEVDVGNAVAMRALSLASYEPAACLDWNNNYADDDDKCILFHCGPVPASMMAGQGHISDHAILANAVGKGNGYGCNVGRIAPMDFTFGSLMTDEGKLKMYLGEGKFTSDPIADDFFGCAGVAEVAHLQDVLLHVGMQGHRHHVSVTPGWVKAPAREALGHYLGFDIALPQE
jgi:L-fucose isomerase-like protein